MASKTRKTQVAANVRAFYSRADYVTPRVALDKAHAKALHAYMKRSGLGVSDAIRAAVLTAAAADKRPATTKRSTVKNRAASQS